MKNFVQPGELLTLTAPDDLTSGQLCQIGSLIVVATADVANGDPFEALVGPAVVTAPKPNDEAWTEGEKLYWDDGAGQVTIDDNTAANPLIGVAAAAAAETDTTGSVRLDGVAR